MLDYCSEPKHKDLIAHYFDGHYTSHPSHFLVFTKDWMDSNLPKCGEQNGLICNLLDTETNTIYKTEIYATYEEDCHNVLDNDYKTIPHWSLMRYFYEDHHCSCHRHTDAVAAGLNENTEGFECEGNRFLIQSITPKDSDLVLYSETMSYEKLESKLK